jgi:aminomuconate-semialdehyde/2-hydroxymuconate-6-semialdehyde dehydrogenase
MEKVLSCIDVAREEGGEILCGGERASVPGRCEDGWFIQPTVVDGLPVNCPTNQEEIFGPVATLIPFDDEDEVITHANGTAYGLSASLWSQDVSRCHRIASRLEVGLVWINSWMLRDLRTPMGGMKSSGVGREGGFEALRFFTEPKNVCVSFG